MTKGCKWNHSQAQNAANTINAVLVKYGLEDSLTIDSSKLIVPGERHIFRIKPLQLKKKYGNIELGIPKPLKTIENKDEEYYLVNTIRLGDTIINDSNLEEKYHFSEADIIVLLESQNGLFGYYEM